MTRPAPYQPSLLRLLHGVVSLLILSAAVSGYLIYEQFDRRWGTLKLPEIDNIMGLHHTIGEITTIVVLMFIIYSFTLGQRRIIQLRSLKQLTHPGKPDWWRSLQQLSNTFLIGAMILAILSGKQMEARWLANEEFDHLPYFVHLSAWGAIGLGVIMHSLMHLKIGGVPLLLSIFSVRIRRNDLPTKWPQQIRQFFQRR